jgi:hypothetical protein
MVDTHQLGEIARRGYEWYERIRPAVEPAHRGEFLAVDVESGGYEIDRQELAAIDRLKVRCPDARVYLIRIGHRAAYRLGGRFQVAG